MTTMAEYYCDCGACDGTSSKSFEQAHEAHARSKKKTDIVPQVYVRFRGITTKDGNPKDIAGTARSPLHMIPLVALSEEALAYLEGALKYGANNWTVEGVRASVYMSACARHLFKWFFGQTRDPTTNVHHLASARVCLGILIDAEFRKKLTDDRPSALPQLDELFANTEKVAQNLFKLYGDKKPRHYTNADTA
jgi:hypothetical protein